MAHYTTITVIYNPNSTGPSAAMARELKAKLQTAGLKQTVALMPTKRAGHAEDLAYKIAQQSKKPLIISASGDGGYHEVINGLMKAQNEGAKPVAGLLPAGNANDHFHSLHENDFIDAIMQAAERQIDLLRLRATVNGQPFERYAHSYIGFGLTPKIGQDLTAVELNPLTEVWSVLKGLWSSQPVRLKVDGTTRRYDSLTCNNASRMAKVLTLSKQSKIDDGKFEITALYHRSKPKLIMALLRATATRLPEIKQVQHFTLQTLQPTLIQLDGETITIDSDRTVTIEVENTTLRCIV